MAEWEQALFNLTSAEWDVAAAKMQIASDGKRFIVFQVVDELVIFVTGYEEDDELSLGDFLKKFIAVLQHSTKKVSKGKLTEAALLECYGKVTSTLDVAVSNGAVHTLDVTELEQFLRLDAVSKEKEKDKKDKKA